MITHSTVNFRMVGQMANGKWRDIIAISKEKEYTHRTGLGQRSVAPAL